MDILKKPVLTEKASLITEKLGRFVFRVDHRATKLQIKAAIEQMYGVNVTGINTMIHGGKAKSRYTKSGTLNGRTSKYKKAVVTLMDGQTIDFYGEG